MKESLQGPLNSAKRRKIAGIKTFSVVTGTHWTVANRLECSKTT